MAGAIKGITVKIGGDTTELGKSLTDATKQSISLQKELKGVNTLLKMDPSNVVLLKQKSELLKKSISETETKLKSLKEVLAKADSGEIQLTSKEYRNLQREIVLTEQKLKGLKDQAKDFGGVVSQQIANTGKKMQDVGGKIEDVGKKMSVVSAGIVAIGAAGIKSVMEMDEGYDTVITKTGATGDALEDLKDQVDKVFSDLPTTAADAGTAIGEVNTRFGLTGEELSNLSEDFIKFANINSTDVNNAIDKIDSIMTKFGVDTNDTTKVLGLLTKAGQDTGLSIDALQNTLASNGATLKEMGLDLTGSVKLLSQFETNGVDATTAIAGLKKAQQNATKQGKTLNQALAESIKAIKTSSSETEALQIATELFGKKGAVEMTQAIREGRLSVDDLCGSLDDYATTVTDTFSATLDPWDDAKVAINNLKLSGAELGQAILTSLTPIITSLIEKIKDFTNWFETLNPAVKTTIVIIGGIVAAIGPVLIIIAELISAVGTIMTLAPAITSIITGIKTSVMALNAVLISNPIGIVIIAITALVGALVYAYNHCESFKNAVNFAFTKVKEVITGVVNTLVILFTQILPSALVLIKNTIVNTWNNIKSFTSSTWNIIKNSIVNTWDNIKNTIVNVANSVKNSVSGVWNAIKSSTSSTWNAIKNAITNPIETARNTINGLIGSIRSIVNNIFAGLKPKLNLSLPRVSVSGGEAPFGIGGHGSLPHFDIKWNALGAIFKKPTIFNTPAGLQGVGEAGAEAVAPITELMDYVQIAVNNSNNGIIDRIAQVENILENYLPIVASQKNIFLDGDVLVGATIDRIDTALGETQQLKDRGV